MTVYRIRRHRRIGDRFEKDDVTYEIVGLRGNGHYLVQMVHPPTEPRLKDTLWPFHEKEYTAGPTLSVNLGLWVEDTTTVRPWPFGP